jgi:hypothetical protein
MRGRRVRKTRRKSSPRASGRATSSQDCSDGVRAGELSKQALNVFFFFCVPPRRGRVF